VQSTAHPPMGAHSQRVLVIVQQATGKGE